MRRQSDPTIVLLKEEFRRLLKLLDKLEEPAANGRFSVPADVWMSPREVIVRFEIPGADPKSLSLLGHPTFLEITGTKSSFAPHAGRYLIAERLCGPFRRAVELPAPVDMSDISAKFEDGVMTVAFRRVNERRGQRRRIEFNIEIAGR